MKRGGCRGYRGCGVWVEWCILGSLDGLKGGGSWS